MLLFHLTFIQYSDQISMKTSFSHFPLQTSNNSTKQKTQFNSLNKSTKSFFHLIISTQQIFFFFSSTLFLQSITNTNTFFDHSKLFTNIHNNKQNHLTALFTTSLSLLQHFLYRSKQIRHQQTIQTFILKSYQYQSK